MNTEKIAVSMPPIKILIVEDEFLIVESLIAKLYKHGYLVCGVSATGESAIEKARSELPDIVLMDIVLRGEMDGIDAADYIKSSLDLPVIYLTAHHDDDVIARAKATHPYGFLIKPFNERELLATIEVALHKDQAEKRIKRQERHYRTLMDNTTQWDFWITPDLEFRHISSTCEQTSGYPPKVFIDDPEFFFKIVHPSDMDRVRARFLVGDGEPAFFDQVFRILDINGREKLIQQSCKPIYSDKGAWEGFRGINIDISEQIRLRHRAYFEKKLEAIGLFAGGISHDFNNLLSVILGNIDLALNYPDADGTSWELLEEARRACFQAKRLIEKYTILSSGLALFMENTNLEVLIRSTVSEFFQESGIQTELSLEKDLPAVWIDPRQMSRALEAVLENAREAMPHGGVISISARAEKVDTESFFEDGSYLKEGFYIRVRIEDQGGGMTPEVREKAFEPYFSTKSRGSQKGMGLGLTITMGVVKKFPGHIRIDSEPGKGTTVDIYLPVTDK